MPKNNVIEIYQVFLNVYIPHIAKNRFELSEGDKVEIKDGHVHITLLDAGVSGHNGDFYDEHEYGYLTFSQAKKDMIKTLKCKHEKEMAHVKSLKEKQC